MHVGGFWPIERLAGLGSAGATRENRPGWPEWASSEPPGWIALAVGRYAGW